MVQAPFIKNISTNVAKRLLNLMDKHFPKDDKLYRIFNRNSAKVCYSGTKTMKPVISTHNKKLLFKSINTVTQYNCRMKNKCPLNGICRTRLQQISNQARFIWKQLKDVFSSVSMTTKNTSFEIVHRQYSCN